MLRFSALLNHNIMKLLSCAVIFCPRAAAAEAAGAESADAVAVFLVLLAGMFGGGDKQ
jgi:hypothetical protein